LCVSWDNWLLLGHEFSIAGVSSKENDMRITYNPYGFGRVIFVVVAPVESIWKHICQHDQNIQSAEVCFKIQAKQ